MILYFHDISANPLDELDQLCGRIEVAQFWVLLKKLESSDKSWIGFDDYLTSRSDKKFCLTFDDAPKGLDLILDKLERQVALMISSGPYLSQYKVLPHQWVEGVYRLKKIPVTDFRETKKTLKKKARAQGVQVYLDWTHSQVNVSELAHFMKEDDRFCYLSEERLRELSSTHALCHHGHLHLPLGKAECSEVLNDQGHILPWVRANSYALPYGDLKGQLPDSLIHYDFIFGTEGPYQDGPKILTRKNGLNLLKELF